MAGTQDEPFVLSDQESDLEPDNIPINLESDSNSDESDESESQADSESESELEQPARQTLYQRIQAVVANVRAQEERERADEGDEEERERADEGDDEGDEEDTIDDLAGFLSSTGFCSPSRSNRITEVNRETTSNKYHSAKFQLLD